MTTTATATAPTYRRKRELTNTYPLTIGEFTIQQVSPSVATACPFCSAGVGEPCRTASGKQTAYGSHKARWREHSSRRRGGHFYVELYRDDPTFGLYKGDVLLAQAYRYDLGKATILNRVADGHDPECNQYWEDLIFLSFAD